MKRLLFLSLLAFAAIVGPAHAQAPILQGGPWSFGHVPIYGNPGSAQPSVFDSGPARGAGVGQGISELNLQATGTGAPPFASQGTGPLGTVACMYDGPITSAAGYHFLCFSANAQGGALIASGAGGAASQLPLNFNINGIASQLNASIPAGALPGLSPTITPLGGPFSSPTFGLNLPNSSQPWIVQAPATSIANDNPAGVMEVIKNTAYSGAASGNVPAFSAVNVIGNGVQGGQSGGLFTAFNLNTTGTGADAIGVTGVATCGVINCTLTQGGAIAGYDISGQINPTKQLIGLEVDNNAHGTDSLGKRIGILLAANTSNGAGVANQVGHGILFFGAGTAIGQGYFVNLIDGGIATTSNGIVLAGVNFLGTIAYNSPGFLVDNVGNLTAQIFTSGSSPGVSCPAGITAGTFRSVNGIVTHC
jgi:hypothetical protein